jgi:hypothetical protein
VNWGQFNKNVGMRVQIEPPACRLDANGHVLPERHDDWLVERISEVERPDLVSGKGSQVIVRQRKNQAGSEQQHAATAAVKSAIAFSRYAMIRAQQLSPNLFLQARWAEESVVDGRNTATDTFRNLSAAYRSRESSGGMDTGTKLYCCSLTGGLRTSGLVSLRWDQGPENRSAPRSRGSRMALRQFTRCAVPNFELS